MKTLNTCLYGNISLFLMVLVFLPISGLAVNAGKLKPRVPSEQLSNAKSLHNPFTVTQDFVANGKALYEGKAFCSACHGIDGTGKQQSDSASPLATPSPRNFGDAAWQAARTDGEIFWILKHGSHGTDMAPFLPLYLTDEEAWQIVTYIRSLGKS